MTTETSLILDYDGFTRFESPQYEEVAFRIRSVCLSVCMYVCMYVYEPRYRMNCSTDFINIRYLRIHP
jgi:hypothetical protein